MQSILEDSHKTLPVSCKDFDALLKSDLVPFTSAICADVTAIMPGHILFPNVDSIYPASLSHLFITEILKDRLGFNGLVICDDIEMEAVNQNNREMDNTVTDAIRAGCDLIIKSGNDKQRMDFCTLLGRITSKAKKNLALRELISNKYRRVLGAKSRLLGPKEHMSGVCPEGMSNFCKRLASYLWEQSAKIEAIR